LSGKALQHAEDGYSRGGNFGGPPVDSMFSMYSPDGSNVYDSGWEFERIRSKVANNRVPGGTSYSILDTFAVGCIA